MQDLGVESVFPQQIKPPVLDVIREKTRGLHAQLEANFDLARSLSTRASYRLLLESYLGIYRPFERILEHQSAAPRLRRARLIENDLVALGATESEIVAVAECSSLLRFKDTDELYGALYVFEGSCLGGQIIYRQIMSLLNIDKHTGSSFFHGDGDRTGLVWKSFLTDLQQHVSSADRAAEGACAMFKVFERWLTQNATKEGLRPQ